MDKVMDRVVETQFKIYNAICIATEFGSFVFLVTGNLVHKCQFACQGGSRVPEQVRGFKTTWSQK